MNVNIFKWNMCSVLADCYLRLGKMAVRFLDIKFPILSECQSDTVLMSLRSYKEKLITGWVVAQPNGNFLLLGKLRGSLNKFVVWFEWKVMLFSCRYPVLPLISTLTPGFSMCVRMTDNSENMDCFAVYRANYGRPI